MLGRARAQRVQATMHIRVFVFIIIADDIEHRSRLLGTGRAIEINQSMTVHALAQDREILAERCPIHLTGSGFMHKLICPKRRFAPVDSGRPPTLCCDATGRAKIDICGRNDL